MSEKSKLDLLGVLMQDERLFSRADDVLGRIVTAAEADGNDRLVAAVTRLRDAFKRFDFDRTAAVVEIIGCLGDGK